MDFVEATFDNAWFEKHPEKIAGKEYETTSFMFPIMVKGTKEDVLRVTGMNEADTDKERKIKIAKAKAMAIKLKMKQNGLK